VLFISLMATAAKLKSQDLGSEFVVGCRTAFEPSAVRTDSRDADERRLTSQAIRHLRLDAEIESDVSILADSVFSESGEILPAVLDEDDAEYAEAEEIADFCKLALSYSRRPVVSILKEMFKAAFYNGVKVGEIVLKLQNDSRVNGKLVIDRINPKPVAATAFVTDKFYNVIGLIGAKRPGQIVTTGAVTISQDEIIPREKFLVLSFELEDNDPRGLSQVRAAYESYCDKQLTRLQWKEWRRTSAIPKKFATTSQTAKPIAVMNSDGTPKITNGVQETITAQKGLMNALEGFANNSAIVGEFGTTVAQLEVKGTGAQFALHFKSCNSEIRKVILGDSLATSEADKDARAARESSKDVIDMRKQALRAVVSDAFRRDVLALLTVVNFGVEKAHLTPEYFLGNTEANDWQGDLNAAAGAGYSFAPEHFRELDAQFGLEPRKDDPEPAGSSDDSNTDARDADSSEGEIEEE
jgi:hypothetical protein